MEVPCLLLSLPVSLPTSPKEKAKQTEAQTSLAAPKMDDAFMRAPLAVSLPSSEPEESEETTTIAVGFVATAGTYEIAVVAEPPVKAAKGFIAKLMA